MTHTPKLFTFFASLSLVLLTGCFDTKQDFTLNPDGSGKVVHECTFQNVNLTDKKQDSEEALTDAVRSLLEQTKGVDAWRDVSFKTLDDGRMFFRGTAYFKNLCNLDMPNQTMLEFDWKQTADGGAVLDLRTNKSKAYTSKGLTMERRTPASTNQLSPDEIAKKIKRERIEFQQSRPMLAGFLGTMKQTTVFHLPGKVTKSSNFATESTGALSRGFDGAKLLEVMEKLINDDAWCQKHGGTGFSNKEKPGMDDEINALIFGEKAPVHATVVKAAAPLFDYVAEVAAAKKEFAKTEQLLGLSAAELAPPAQGAPLKSLKVVGVQFVSQSNQKQELQPFNSAAGYSLALLAELPGSVLSISDETQLITALADDGTSLMPDTERGHTINFPKLSKDRTSVLLTINLALPASGIKGLKELSGKICYKVSTGTKEVDLGIDELKTDAKGTNLSAQIESIKEGWQEDGSQEMELKLKLTPEDIKSLSMVVDGDKTVLDRRGYYGSGSSYTINFQCKQAFPAKARLLAEIYDQVQTFEVPFKLENITLLGASRNEAK